MKPTCLTPGCVLPFDHTVAHSKTETGPYAGFADSAVRTATASAIPLGEPTRFYERPQYTNLPPRPVTLEGLAAAIPQLVHAVHEARSDESEVYESAKRTLLAALARTRGILGVEESDDLPDDDVGSPPTVMSKEDMEKMMAEHLKQHLAHSDDSATYNLAIDDAASAVLDVFGPFTGDVREDVRKAIFALRKETT